MLKWQSLTPTIQFAVAPNTVEQRIAAHLFVTQPVHVAKFMATNIGQVNPVGIIGVNVDLHSALKEICVPRRTHVVKMGVSGVFENNTDIVWFELNQLGGLADKRAQMRGVPLRFVDDFEFHLCLLLSAYFTRFAHYHYTANFRFCTLKFGFKSKLIRKQ